MYLALVLRAHQLLSAAIRHEARQDFSRAVSVTAESTRNMSMKDGAKACWGLIKRMMKFSGKSKYNSVKTLPILYDESGQPVRNEAEKADLELRHFAGIEAATLHSPDELVAMYNQRGTDNCQVPLGIGNVIDPLALQLAYSKLNPNKATTDQVPLCVIAAAPAEFARLHHPLHFKMGLCCASQPD